MIIRYKYGIIHNGIIYGWYDKKLYRLPQMIGKRYYPLLELTKWSNKGYHIGKVKKSFAQLESMTIFIDKEIQQIKDSSCPF